jgi:predicted RNA-binding Zn-ribbon protein involved in translation (DUF1610 family)
MITNEQVPSTQPNQSLQCPVCGDAMAFQIARGRKSGKPFLMVKCLRDGRHFRGFVGDREYVTRLLERLEVGNNGKTIAVSQESSLITEY